MNRLDLIIDALESAYEDKAGWCDKVNEALYAARELRELEPVVWVEHEWSGTGVTHLHFDRRKPTLRDEVLNPVWTPLYALEVMK
jgi:hypothetical protein